MPGDAGVEHNHNVLEGGDDCKEYKTMTGSAIAFSVLCRPVPGQGNKEAEEDDEIRTKLRNTHNNQSIKQVFPMLDARDISDVIAMASNSPTNATDDM
jgi:hypothetical protein